MSYLLVQARPELLARPLYAVRYKNIWLNIGHVYYSCRSLPASVDMAETSFTSGILFDGEEEAEEGISQIPPPCSKEMNHLFLYTKFRRF